LAPRRRDERGSGSNTPGQRPEQPRHPSAHGSQPDAKGQSQRIPARQIQTRRMGRGLFVKPHRTPLKCNRPADKAPTPCSGPSFMAPWHHVVKPWCHKFARPTCYWGGHLNERAASAGLAGCCGCVGDRPGRSRPIATRSRAPGTGGAPEGKRLPGDRLTNETGHLGC